MKATIESLSAERAVRCAVCENHTRPEYVPWQQHTVGCLVRAGELARRGRDRRPPVSLVAGALHL